MAPRCTCDKGSYWQPPDVDPGCPFHGYDEDTGERLPPWEPDEPDEPDDCDDAVDGPMIDRRFYHYPY